MFKLFLSSVLLLSLIVGCGQSKPSELKEEVIEVADTKAELIVEGMSCQVGCAAYIDEELEKIHLLLSLLSEMLRKDPKMKKLYELYEYE